VAAAALEDRGSRDGWQQVRIDFAEWHTAEQTGVARLRPALAQAETAGILTRWFFTRKAARGMTGNDGADKSGKEVAEFLAGSLDASLVRSAGRGGAQDCLGVRDTPHGSVRLDLVDLRRNRKAPKFGSYGSLMVRFGKASKGSAPKRRTMLTVPEMDWVVDILQDWLTEVGPRFTPGRHPALWVTERVGRLSPRSINEAFVAARRAADLDEDLDLHCLRHSYITHLTEFGYPARFVQEQVGHSHAATTAIYMGVSNEYRNKLLEAAMKNRLGDDWDVTA
jgi:hypothetical protein